MSTYLSRRRIASYIAREVQAGHTDALKKLAAYLITEGRTNEVDLLALDIEAALEAHGHIIGHVTSAHELSSATKQAITDFIKEQTGATHVKLQTSLDEEMVAGFRLSLPHRQLDATVPRILQQLTNQ